MAQSTFRVDIPNCSWIMSQITPIDGGNKFTFHYYPMGSVYADISPCVSYSIASADPDGGQSPCSITITFDDGVMGRMRARKIRLVYQDERGKIVKWVTPEAVSIPSEMTTKKKR